MTEQTDDAKTTETPPGSAAEQPDSQGGIPFVKIAAVLITFGVAAWAGYIYVTGGEKFDFRRFAFLGEEKIEFHKVTGQVFFNGEPVNDGHLELYPADGSKGADRMIGPIDKDGNFELFTDFGGKLSEGAPPGEYKALLMVSYPTLPLQPPIHKLPPEYYDVAKTPIRITVTSDPEKNKITIKEEGEIQPNTSASGPGGPPRGDRPVDEGSDADGTSDDGSGTEIERPATEDALETNDAAEPAN